MSRKHNTKHPARGRSNYPKRLAKRGLSKTPVMQDVDYLRRVQQRREEEFGFPWKPARQIEEDVNGEG